MVIFVNVIKFSKQVNTCCINNSNLFLQKEEPLTLKYDKDKQKKATIESQMK